MWLYFVSPVTLYRYKVNKLGVGEGIAVRRRCAVQTKMTLGPAGGEKVVENRYVYERNCSVYIQQNEKN